MHFTFYFKFIKLSVREAQQFKINFNESKSIMFCYHHFCLILIVIIKNILQNLTFI